MELSLVAGELEVFSHVAHARLMGVKAGHQSSPRGTAAGGIEEVGEAQAVLGEFVEIGRFDLAAVAADVRVAQIVRENDDDVGRILFYLGVDSLRANHREDRGTNEDCRTTHGETSCMNERILLSDDTERCLPSGNSRACNR